MINQMKMLKRRQPTQRFISFKLSKIVFEPCFGIFQIKTSHQNYGKTCVGIKTNQLEQ